MGEFFHSTDNGLHWDVPAFSELRSSNSARVKFSGDPLIRYALQGGDVPGISKSTDGGVTFAPLAADPTGGEAYSLWVDPNSSSRLLVSDYTTLYISTNGGTSFVSRYSNGGGLHIAGVLWAGDSIYVGSSSGLLVSTNGGTSFAVLNITGIPAGRTLLSLCGARSGATVRLFITTAATGDVYPGVGGGDFGICLGVYTWDAGQPAWTLRTGGIAGTDRLFYIDCAANDINIAYAAGASESIFQPIVLKTVNGGVSWTGVLNTVNNANIATGWMGDHGDLNWGWAECPLGFAVSATNPLRALVTDYGFAHVTNDGGVTWRQVYEDYADANPAGAWTPRGLYYQGNGLEPTAVWNVMWADSLVMIGSYTDIRGTRSTDGGQSWARLKIDTSGTYSVNTVYHVVKHPTTGALYAATSSVHDLYQSTYLTDGNIDGGRGQIWQSSNNGATWSVLHDFVHPVIWLALDPTNGNRLYASVVHSTLGGIFVTSDLQNGSGSAWTRVSVPPTTQGHPFNVHVLNDGTLVCTYSGRRTATAFTASSGVFVSTNGGSTWANRTDAMMVYWTKDLVLDPHDATQSTWYVTVRRGWGGAPNNLGGLFKTTDRGLSWTRIYAELFAEGCAVDPLDANVLYLTTSGNGLWFTADLQSATPTFTQLVQCPFGHATRPAFNPYDASEVWICSFGNGLRKGSTGVAPNAVDDLTIAVEGANVVLRWASASGASEYKIYRGDVADFSLATLVTTQSTLTYNEAWSGGMKFYWVTAGN
jgi:photosystem II stability/assembly factor-like uncharacterized protein